MRRSFLGVIIEVPESWSDRSLALFASPPGEETGPALPMLNRRRRGPEMSVTVTPPSPLEEGASAATRLRSTLGRMQAVDRMQVESTGREASGSQSIAWAVCSSHASDGRCVRQLIAVVGNERVTAGFSGSVAASDFERAQTILWDILRSIRLERDAAESRNT